MRPLICTLAVFLGLASFAPLAAPPDDEPIPRLEAETTGMDRHSGLLDFFAPNALFHQSNLLTMTFQ